MKKKLEFWKMNGSGNDFILIDNRDGAIKDDEMHDFVARVCRRRVSVGADGVIFVLSSEQYDFSWKFFNADGGEVAMCGNGGRCVARFAFLKKIAGPHMTFETMTGPVSAEVHGRNVKVLMPDPSPLTMDIALPNHAEWLSADYVDTGVPHVVVQVDHLHDHPVFDQGRFIRYHPLLAPAGTNANFMSVVSHDMIAVRTYERGVEDETLACGTGSIASALVACARGMVSSPVRVKTAGGEELRIYFQREGEGFKHIWLEGNTSISYDGHLHEEAFGEQ